MIVRFAAIASLALVACSSTKQAQPGEPPTATASATPTTGTAPLDVQLQCDTTGGTAPLAFKWDFGDGTSSEVQGPSHTYTTAGMFTATCEVTDADGNTASSPVAIQVNSADVAPKAVIQVENTDQPSCAVTAQTMVQLSAAMSTSPDGGTLWYEWALISAPAGSTAQLSSNFGETPTLQPDIDGDYVIRLHVSEDSGLSDTTDLKITSQSASQIVTVSGDAQMAAGNSSLMPVVVEVETACGLPVAGQQVDFAIASGEGTVTPASGTSDATGQVSTDVALSCQLGAGTLTATLTGTTISDALSFTTTLGPPAAVVLQQPTDVQVPGPMTVRAEVHDACGNLVTTDNATTFTLSISEATADASAMFSMVTTGTAVDTTDPEAWVVRVAGGVVEATLTDSQAEAITFGMTDSQGTGLDFEGGAGSNYDQTQSNVGISCNGGTVMVTFTGAQPPSGAGTLTISGTIDSDTSDEKLLAYGDSTSGTLLGSYFGTGVYDCDPQSQAMTVAQADLASLATAGTITLALQTTSTVDCFCAPDQVSVELTYPATTTASFTP